MSATRMNRGGPSDGAGMYPEGTQPCLVCGWYVPTDHDGLVSWHVVEVDQNTDLWADRCPGSRTSWEIPEWWTR